MRRVSRVKNLSVGPPSSREAQDPTSFLTASACTCLPQLPPRHHRRERDCHQEVRWLLLSRDTPSFHVGRRRAVEGLGGLQSALFSANLNGLRVSGGMGFGPPSRLQQSVCLRAAAWDKALFAETSGSALFSRLSDLLRQPPCSLDAFSCIQLLRR